MRPRAGRKRPAATSPGAAPRGCPAEVENGREKIPSAPLRSAETLVYTRRYQVTDSAVVAELVDAQR